MESENISFLSNFKNIRNIFDDNMGIAIELDNGHKYMVVVTTQKNSIPLMNNKKNNSLSSSNPIVIVRKLIKKSC